MLQFVSEVNVCSVLTKLYPPPVRYFVTHIVTAHEITNAAMIPPIMELITIASLTANKKNILWCMLLYLLLLLHNYKSKNQTNYKISEMLRNYDLTKLCTSKPFVSFVSL